MPTCWGSKEAWYFASVRPDLAARVGAFTTESSIADASTSQPRAFQAGNPPSRTATLQQPQHYVDQAQSLRSAVIFSHVMG